MSDNLYVNGNNRKEGIPLAHYRARYKNLDPEETSRRCALPFDAGASVFSLRFLGTNYRAGFPGFRLVDAGGNALESAPEEILVLRYLCEGRHSETTGKQLSYHDIPWGEVYYRNFEGRCLKRLAFTFGHNIESFRRAMTGIPGLDIHPLKQGDAGYRFEFMTGLYMSLLLWAADDEFPPSAQILFDDNFVTAFTAEDLAVAGDIVINRLKKAQKNEAEFKTESK
jgi:hypothetical protein